MAPKRSKVQARQAAEGSGKTFPQSSRAVADDSLRFEPDSVTEEDRTSLLMDMRDGFDQMYTDLVYFLRYSATFSKCYFNRKMPKLRCGDKGDYRSLFVIVDVYCGGEKIQLLIYKPIVYLLAVFARNQWWCTTDFTTHTGLTFPKATPIGYDSRYEKLPTTLSFEVFRSCIFDLMNPRVRIGDTNSSFKTLCFLLCEPIRFNSMLYKVVPMMVDQTCIVEFDSFVEWLIKNWETLSELWILFDLGYVWNVTDVEGMKIKDEENAFKAISLLLNVQSSEILRRVQNLRKDEEEEEKNVVQKLRKDEEKNVEKVLRYRIFDCRDVKYLEEVIEREIGKRERDNKGKKEDRKQLKRIVEDEFKFLDGIRKEINKNRLE